MISISVTSYNGASTAPWSAHFDETGGNIGRAENNELVLPDPERTISRVHAQVVYRNGRYAIVDRGSNPISVNGRPLGNGQEAMIGVGDELNIGGYVMRVEAALCERRRCRGRRSVRRLRRPRRGAVAASACRVRPSGSAGGIRQRTRHRRRLPGQRRRPAAFRRTGIRSRQTRRPARRAVMILAGRSARCRDRPAAASDSMSAGAPSR